MRMYTPDGCRDGSNFRATRGGGFPGGNTARQVLDDQDVEGSAQQQPYHDPRNNQHNPPCANYWAPLTRKRHHKEHRPSEHSDPTQHAKGKNG